MYTGSGGTYSSAQLLGGACLSPSDVRTHGPFPIGSISNWARF